MQSKMVEYACYIVYKYIDRRELVQRTASENMISFLSALKLIDRHYFVLDKRLQSSQAFFILLFQFRTYVLVQ